MLDELEWPTVEASLTFFYKIHSGIVSPDKDKYLTPAKMLRVVTLFHVSLINSQHSCPVNSQNCSIIYSLVYQKLLYT